MARNRKHKKSMPDKANGQEPVNTGMQISVGAASMVSRLSQQISFLENAVLDANGDPIAGAGVVSNSANLVAFSGRIGVFDHFPTIESPPASGNWVIDPSIYDTAYQRLRYDTNAANALTAFQEEFEAVLYNGAGNRNLVTFGNFVAYLQDVEEIIATLASLMSLKAICNLDWYGTFSEPRPTEIQALERFLGLDAATFATYWQPALDAALKLRVMPSLFNMIRDFHAPFKSRIDSDAVLAILRYDSDSPQFFSPQGIAPLPNAYESESQLLVQRINSAVAYWQHMLNVLHGFFPMVAPVFPEYTLEVRPDLALAIANVNPARYPGVEQWQSYPDFPIMPRGLNVEEYSNNALEQSAMQRHVAPYRYSNRGAQVWRFTRGPEPMTGLNLSVPINVAVEGFNYDGYTCFNTGFANFVGVSGLYSVVGEGNINYPRWSALLQIAPVIAFQNVAIALEGDAATFFSDVLTDLIAPVMTFGVESDVIGTFNLSSSVMTQLQKPCTFRKPGWRTQSLALAKFAEIAYPAVLDNLSSELRLPELYSESNMSQNRSRRPAIDNIAKR